MPKVKNCPHIALPPPDPSLPPPPPLIPTSVVTKKSVPSAPPPVPISTLITKDVPSAPTSTFPPPTKKVCPPPPFIKGQVGRKFFSLQQLRSFCNFHDRCSLIVSCFWKPLPHENCKSKYIIIDPYGSTWLAPHVFEVWREEIESGALTKDEFITHCIAIVRDGNNFFLSFSDIKSKVNLVTYQIQKHSADEEEEEEAFPLADSEDECKKRDPDFHPDNIN